jgi:hypothetical protein
MSGRGSRVGEKMIDLDCEYLFNKVLAEIKNTESYIVTGLKDTVHYTPAFHAATEAEINLRILKRLVECSKK